MMNANENIKHLEELMKINMERMERALFSEVSNYTDAIEAAQDIALEAGIARYIKSMAESE